MTRRGVLLTAGALAVGIGLAITAYLAAIRLAPPEAGGQRLAELVELDLRILTSGSEPVLQVRNPHEDAYLSLSPPTATIIVETPDGTEVVRRDWPNRDVPVSPVWTNLPRAPALAPGQTRHYDFPWPGFQELCQNVPPQQSCGEYYQVRGVFTFPFAQLLRDGETLDLLSDQRVELPPRPLAAARTAAPTPSPTPTASAYSSVGGGVLPLGTYSAEIVVPEFVDAGQPVRMRLLLSNPRTDGAPQDLGLLGSYFNFVVTDSTDKLIWHWGHAKPLDDTPFTITLEHGKPHVTEIDWPLVNLDGRPVPGGVYWVHGVVRTAAVGERHVGRDKKMVFVGPYRSLQDLITVSLDVPDSVRHGEPVPLKMRVQNVSKTPLKLWGSHASFDFRVYDSSGREVWHLWAAVLPAQTSFLLQGGEILRYEVNWDQKEAGQIGVPRGEPFPERVQQPPGSYSVIAFFGGWLRDSPPPQDETVTSKRRQFSIRAGFLPW